MGTQVGCFNSGRWILRLGLCLQLTQEITAAVVAALASSYAHQPLVQAYRSSHHRRSEGIAQEAALCPAEFQKRARYNCEADLHHVPALHLCSTLHQCSAFLLCIALLFILHSVPHIAVVQCILTLHCTAAVPSDFALYCCCAF